MLFFFESAYILYLKLIIRSIVNHRSLAGKTNIVYFCFCYMADSQLRMQIDHYMILWENKSTHQNNFVVWAKFDYFLLHKKLTKIWSHIAKKRKGLLKWILVRKLSFFLHITLLLAFTMWYQDYMQNWLTSVFANFLVNWFFK